MTDKTGTHTVGATFIELQAGQAEKLVQDYDCKIAELVETYYQIPYGTLGFNYATTEVG